MHGAGNDYIYVDNTKYPIANPEEKSITWSKPHTGIGSDGLVLIDKSKIADFSMRIFNADGSEAMMCGNASRCIGKYLYEYGLTAKREISLETLSGIKLLKLSIKENTVEAVTVDMGEPSMELIEYREGGIKEEMIAQPIKVNGKEYKATAISMGNPHLVIFVEDITTVDLPIIGPVLACGTGACATAVAAFINKKSGRTSNVVMDGGTLTIEWDEKSNHVFMTGPATKVFDGEIEVED
jgi:diaminopimelate epimerase